MPDDRLERTRRAYTDSTWEERADRLFDEYLRENLRSARFPFTPHGIAACVDDAIGRAVYGTQADMDALLQALAGSCVRKFEVVTGDDGVTRQVPVPMRFEAR